ncbi:MAG: MBL fold metallo-hydrolase [Vicinamibacteraceae bacterium]
MKPGSGLVVTAAVLAVGVAVGAAALSSTPVSAQSDRNGTVERLYVLDGGVGHAGNANSWSNMMDPPGTPLDIAAPCHLIRHATGYFMFDTCPNDIIASMPNGHGTSAGAIRWTKTKTIASQLAELKIAPSEIKYIGISHSHADHTGNIHMFPDSIVVIQRREYLNAFEGNSAPSGPPTFAGAIFPREHP